MRPLILIMLSSATLVLLVIAGPIGWHGWRASVADPIVRRATIALPDWPAGARPIRVALIADLHFGNAATGPDRMRRVAALVMRQKPDLILHAGDFVAGYDAASATESARRLAPILATLHAPLGSVAVLGNHDQETAPRAITRALASADIAVLENQALRRGPLLIGGSGDTVSGHAKLRRTLNALRRLRAQGPGAIVYLSHAPEIVRWLPPGPALLLAGHTHCGQVVLPWIGPLIPVSTVNGNRYLCGLIREADKTIVVTGGIGTSNAPIRIGAPSDIWILTLGPPAATKELPKVRAK